MAQELDELYKQYGEVTLRLEYFQQRALELKTKIVRIIEAQSKGTT